MIAEASWLLRDVPGGVIRLFELLDADLIRCLNLDQAIVPWMIDFLHRYADLKPQVADGSLVYLAEVLSCDLVFTLDRRDFVVFRNKHGTAFRLVPEVV